VIDFFNSALVAATFCNDYTENRGDITFEIEKKIEKNVIIKHIEFSDKGKNYYFEEAVSLLTKDHFTDFAQQAGLKLENCYGNYKLEKFDSDTSERLILIFKK